MTRVIRLWAPKPKPGRPVERGSIRETARREGKTVYQIRKERGEFLYRSTRKTA